MMHPISACILDDNNKKKVADELSGGLLILGGLFIFM